MGNAQERPSLAEAFEWLWTGELFVGACNNLVPARELACCIANQLRPRVRKHGSKRYLSPDYRQFSAATGFYEGTMEHQTPGRHYLDFRW